MAQSLTARGSGQPIRQTGMRDRIRTNERLRPIHAEVSITGSVVWVGRENVAGDDGRPVSRPCIDAVTDGGRRVFVRFARDGSRLDDPAVMRHLARTLLDTADRIDGRLDTGQPIHRDNSPAPWHIS